LALVYSRPLVGLTVPALLILGQILWYKWYYDTLAQCVCPQRFFYLRLEKRNMEYVFCIGILIGGIVAFSFYQTQIQLLLMLALEQNLATYGITNINGMLPEQIFSWENLFTLKGFIMIVMVVS
jgi:hypothetical protein